MKILIFTCCSKSKSIKFPNQPICNELTSKEKKEYFLARFPDKRKAAELFRGPLNISINSAVRQLREFFDVQYYIVTAGFGIVNEEEILPPHDCSFNEMNKEKVQERAQNLEIPEDYRKIVEEENPDLIYLALGRNYLEALGEWDSNLPCTTIAFAESNSNNVISLPADHIAVHEISALGGMIHGASGYKGDLLLLTTRYLKNQKNPEKALKEILDDPDDLVYTINSIREHSY